MKLVRSVLTLGVFVVVFLPGNLGAQYMGSDFCLACHNGVVQPDKSSWLQTFHHKAYADPDAAPGVVPDADFQAGLDLETDPDFSQYNPAPVLGYNAADPGDSTDMTSGYEVTIGNITYTVNRIQGGNGWKQRFQTQVGNSHYVLPIQYNLASDDWVVYSGGDWYDAGNLPLYDDPATLEDDIEKVDSSERRCDGCHTTGLEVEWDASGDSAYTATYAEIGVGCEKCHGPFSMHPNNPSENDNTARVNEICGQCHNRGHSVDQLGPATFDYPWNATNGAFTSGDSLDAFFVSVNPTDNPSDFWPDDMHSKSHRQQFLDFYQSAKPTFAFHEVRCYECHDPHGSANDHDIVEEILEIEGSDTLHIPTENDNNTLCLACHATHGAFEALTPDMIAEYDANIDTISTVVSAHTHHGYDPENLSDTGGSSRCTKCHQPKVAKSAVAYDIHSHTFEPIPPEKTINTQGEGGMPNACAVSCHRNPSSPNIEDFDITDGSLTNWAEASDVALADTLMYYYGPNGIWWSTTGIGNGGSGGNNLPRAYSLSQNFPNPFNPSTRITFDIPASNGSAAVTTTLRVYDLRGALIRTLYSGAIAPGTYTMQWNGKTEGGEKVSSGVYLYRLDAGDFSSTRKMVVVK